MGRLRIYDDEGKLQNFDPSGNMSVTDNDAQHNTLSVAEIVGGIIVHTSVTGAGNVTTDTAAHIIEGYNGVGALKDIGDTITCYYINDGGAYALTIVGGTNVTVADDGQTITQNESAVLLFRRTAATTVTVYVIGA